MSNQKKIKEIIAEFEKSITDIEAETNGNVVPLKGRFFPKHIDLIKKEGAEKVIQHLQSALQEIEKTRKTIFQKALEAVSQDEMLTSYEELNNAAEAFDAGTKKDIDLHLKGKKNEWAEAVILYFELNELANKNLNP